MRDLLLFLAEGAHLLGAPLSWIRKDKPTLVGGSVSPAQAGCCLHEKRYGAAEAASLQIKQLGAMTPAEGARPLKQAGQWNSAAKASFHRCVRRVFSRRLTRPALPPRNPRSSQQQHHGITLQRVARFGIGQRAEKSRAQQNK